MTYDYITAVVEPPTVSFSFVGYDGDANTMVQTFISCHLDYCNALLCGISADLNCAMPVLRAVSVMHDVGTFGRQIYTPAHFLGHSL